VVPEAKVEVGVPQGEGWFVLNARDARWLYNELGGYCPFEGREEAQFPQVGINLNWLPPGKPMTMYHAEDGQEGFLVLSGECLLIVEGEAAAARVGLLPLRAGERACDRRGRRRPVPRARRGRAR
jgi:hypothetical protein